jgi:hypothetical protein
MISLSIMKMVPLAICCHLPAWKPSITKEEWLLLELTVRLQQQTVAMKAVSYFNGIMNNVAANTSNMAAASTLTSMRQCDLFSSYTQ